MIPVGIAIAAAAYIHAASETETFFVGPGAAGRLGLDAHIEGELVATGFRAEMARLQPQAQSELPGLSDSLIALARDSFAADPLEVASLRTIALGSVLQDDPERALRIMRIAAQISKRDDVTNLWLAQHYGRVGDVEEMVASFDHALRTSARVREFAIKPVVETLASDESHIPLGKLLAQRPEWERAFWSEFVRNPVSLSRAADFFETAAIPLDQLTEGQRKALYASLKRNGEFDALYRIAALDPEARTGAAALAAGRFATAADGNPLGWTLRSQGSFAANVHARTGELQIDARAGSFGIAADRVVRGEGDYRMTITMAEQVPGNAEINLTVRCAEGAKRELVRLPVGPGNRAEEVAFSAQGCPFANVELSFAVDPGRRDALIRIASIALRPV